MGLSNYSDTHETYPFGAIGNQQLTAEHRWSWYPQLAPYLAQQAAPPIDYLTDSRDSRNWPLTFTVAKSEPFTVTLQAPVNTACPNGKLEVGEHAQVYASYVGITGIGPDSATSLIASRTTGIWGYDRCTSAAKIPNGLSNTILLSETASDRDVWLFGGRPTARWVSESERPIGANGTFGGFHSGIAITGMADGSVVSLSEKIDPLQFARLATIDKGDDLMSHDLEG